MEVIETTIGEFFETVLEGGEYEIETPQGWKPLLELVKKQKENCFVLRLEGGVSLGASDDHLVQVNGEWTPVKNVNAGDQVNVRDGLKKVVSKEYLGARTTFDFQVGSEEHAYYSNDIVSHNSGKSTIGHVVCNYAKTATVIWITPDLIEENNAGKTSIKLLYMLADFVSPSVIILEDLDLFSEDREGVVDQLRLGALMNILDGVNSVVNAVTIATTNRIGLVEKALSNRPGRFDSVVEIPALESSLRHRMFKDRFAACSLDADALAYLVENSNNWTGAECQEFVNRTNLYFINKNEDKDRKVTKDVITEVLKIMLNM